VIGPHMPLQNLDIQRPTNLTDQVADVGADFAAQHRLAILRDEDEVIVQRIDRVRRPTVLPHARQRIASLLKASPEGEGVHPSQNGTLT